jgi:hypothetical protein
MKTGQGFVLVYSVTSRASFDAIPKLHTQILRIKEDNEEVSMVFPSTDQYRHLLLLLVTKQI